MFHLLITIEANNTHNGNSVSPGTMEQPSFEDSEPKDRGDSIETNDEEMVRGDAGSSGNISDQVKRRISNKKKIKRHEEENNTKTVENRWQRFFRRRKQSFQFYRNKNKTEFKCGNDEPSGKDMKNKKELPVHKTGKQNEESVFSKFKTIMQNRTKAPKYGDEDMPMPMPPDIAMPKLSKRCSRSKVHEENTYDKVAISIENIKAAFKKGLITYEQMVKIKQANQTVASSHQK